MVAFEAANLLSNISADPADWFWRLVGWKNGNDCMNRLPIRRSASECVRVRQS